MNMTDVKQNKYAMRNGTKPYEQNVLIETKVAPSDPRFECILAEGARALSVTLSGGALFAS